MVIDGNINIVCIGTPKLKVDSLGPLVGTKLYENRIHDKYKVTIVGTLKSPVNALNMHKVLCNLPTAALTIAVDAAVGEVFGVTRFRPRPVSPGSGVGKQLPNIGDVSFIGVTTTEQSAFYSSIISDHDLHSMADRIVSMIDEYLNDVSPKKGLIAWAKQLKRNLLDVTV